mmetsp:Transcript_1932/g.3771  ORF Transcript_1932/g.3771 Transcript_1932/m.3771 type:complete len:210 (-) Transcript_1932:36-665(-)
MVTVRVLLQAAGSNANNLRGVKSIVQRGRLAGITDPQHAVVAALRIHLLECVSQVVAGDFFKILEFDELCPTVPRNENEDVGLRVRHQPLVSRRLGRVSSCQQSQEIFDRDLVPAVVHLHLLPIQIQVVVVVVKHSARDGIPRVAGRILSQHQNDLAVRDPKPFHGVIKGQGVGHMPVVVPIPRSVHQYSPIIPLGCRGTEASPSSQPH